MSTQPGDDVAGNAENRPWVPPAPLEAPTAPAPPHAPAPGATTPTSAGTSPRPRESTPWPTSRRWALASGITAASLGLLAAIVAAIVVLATAITDAVEWPALGAEPLLSGAPGDPTPRESTDCEDPCFGQEHVPDARLDTAEFVRLGTPDELDPVGTYLDTSPREQYAQTVEYWRSSSLTPEDCMFTGTETPTIVVAGEPPTADDAIVWLRSFESEPRGSSAVRALRLFATAADAAAHMRQLHALVPQCSRYGVGQFDALWSTSVTPMPALDLPSTVAAVGWVETIEGVGRYYAVDVVRSNAVIRFTVFSDTGVTEAGFRTLAETMADDMASWPLEGSVSGYGIEEPPSAGIQTGQGGATTPREPCDGECFDAGQALALAPTASDLAELGLTRAGDADPIGTTAGEALDARQAIETSNAQCRYSLGIEPVVLGNPSGSTGARLDELVDLGRFERPGASIRIVARVLENPERAESYASAAEFASRYCSRQNLGGAQGDDLVTTLPAKIVGYNSSSDPIVVDRETRHLGWQHDGGRTDQGHEFQHGNIAVRVVIDSEGGRGLTDEEVARLLLPLIDRLESLEPAA